MEKKTDTHENAVFEGTITIVEAGNVQEYGAGNLEVTGSIYTDVIRENTGNIGVDLEDTIFNDGYFDKTNIVTPIAVPGKERFFFNNNLFKSLSDTSKLTTYQPINTKGDILAHNSETQVRLPIGFRGSILTADPFTGTSLKWSRPFGFDITQKTKAVLFGTEQENSAYIISKYTDSYFINVYPYNRLGASCNFFTSKSNISSNYPSIVRLNNNNSLQSNQSLHLDCKSYSEFEMFKKYTESNGEYFIGNNNTYNSTDPPNTEETGVYLFSINSTLEAGPTINILLIKNDSSSNTSLKVKLTSGGGGDIPITWNAFQKINIPNTYTVVDNSQFFTYETVNLTGTTSVTLKNSRFYLNKSGIITIQTSNLIQGSPKALITFSKNSPNFSGNKTIFQVKGLLSDTGLNMSFDSQNRIKIFKTSNFYNGDFIVGISPL